MTVTTVGDRCRVWFELGLGYVWINVWAGARISTMIQVKVRVNIMTVVRVNAIG